MAAPASDPLYGKFYNEMAGQIGVDPGNLIFLPAASQTLFDWNIDVPTANPSVAQYDFLNSIPYSPGSKFFYQYQSIVGSALTVKPEPEQEEAMRRFEVQVSAIDERMYNYRISHLNAYHNAPEGLYTSFEQYKEENGYQGRLDTWLQEKAHLESEIRSIISSQNYDVLIAQNKIGDGLPQYEQVVGNSANQSSRPEWHISQSAAAAAVQLANSPATSFEVQLSSATSSYDFSETYLSGALSYGGFFGLYAGGSWSSFNVDSSSQEFSMTIKIHGAVNIEVTPGDWFYSPVLSLVSDPDNLNDGWSPYKESGNNNRYILGPGGELNSMLKSFTVFEKMTTTITLSEEDYSRHHTAWEASTGLQIGPFRFGASVHGSKTNVDTHADSHTITVETDSALPVILAMEAIRFGAEQ